MSKSTKLIRNSQQPLQGHRDWDSRGTLRMVWGYLGVLTPSMPCRILRGLGCGTAITPWILYGVSLGVGTRWALGGHSKDCGYLGLCSVGFSAKFSGVGTGLSGVLWVLGGVIWHALRRVQPWEFPSQRQELQKASHESGTRRLSPETPVTPSLSTRTMRTKPENLNLAPCSACCWLSKPVLVLWPNLWIHPWCPSPSRPSIHNFSVADSKPGSLTPTRGARFPCPACVRTQP